MTGFKIVVRDNGAIILKLCKGIRSIRIIKFARKLYVLHQDIFNSMSLKLSKQKFLALGI
jgi:hypothetical protein